MKIMSYEQQVFYASFGAKPTLTPLRDMITRLLKQQISSWPTFADAYSSLTNLQSRRIRCQGFYVSLQFNPRRIVSTAALVDPNSTKNRPCFLCTNNLPEEQRGIAYREIYLILCNPYPLFPGHLTIAAIDHRPQEINEELRNFLILAKDISPAFTIFYNGARCGASAPDHLHFQAAPRGAIPLEKSIGHRKKAASRKRLQGAYLYGLEGLGREILVVEGKTLDAVEAVVHKITAILRKILAGSEEPMLNIICTYIRPHWRVVIFPRLKHRPDYYFLNDSQKITVSPGAVDMGGLLITPLKKDFESLHAAVVQQIYSEVSMDKQTIEQIFDSL